MSHSASSEVMRNRRRWAVGRIYETRGGPDHLRWFWSFTVTCPMTRSDRVSTLEEAKAQLADASRELRE